MGQTDSRSISSTVGRIGHVSSELNLSQARQRDDTREHPPGSSTGRASSSTRLDAEGSLSSTVDVFEVKSRDSRPSRTRQSEFRRKRRTKGAGRVCAGPAANSQQQAYMNSTAERQLAVIPAEPTTRLLDPSSVVAAQTALMIGDGYYCCCCPPPDEANATCPPPAHLVQRDTAAEIWQTSGCCNRCCLLAATMSSAQGSMNGLRLTNRPTVIAPRDEQPHDCESPRPAGIVCAAATGACNEVAESRMKFNQRSATKCVVEQSHVGSVVRVRHLVGSSKSGSNRSQLIQSLCMPDNKLPPPPPSTPASRLSSPTLVTANKSHVQEPLNRHLGDIVANHCGREQDKLVTCSRSPPTTSATDDDTSRVQADHAEDRMVSCESDLLSNAKEISESNLSGCQGESSELKSSVASEQSKLASEESGQNLEQFEQQQQQHQQQEQQHEQQRQATRHLAWNDLALRYGKMSRRGVQKRQCHPGQHYNGNNDSGDGRAGQRPRGRFRQSCFSHVACALLQTIFPIIGSFKKYSLPGDLASDLAAGFTVAILHIPQGMAYGLLSGVEPIYGLYVSFIPVLVMSLMSKSLHVSYGTFAIISMLLANTINQVRSALREGQMELPASNSSGNPASAALVITNNHQPAEASRQADLLLKRLIQQSRSTLVTDDERVEPAASYPTDPILVGGVAAELAQSANNLLAPSNIEILSCVCIVCGIIHITMSLTRLGILSLMFSDQLVSSFTTAGAIHVITSQLAGLFDLKLEPISDELLKCSRIWWQFTMALLHDGFNQTTALLSVASIIFLLTIKELIEPRLQRRFPRLPCLPSELVLMALVIWCSHSFKFQSDYHVKVVGHVPTGLPEAKVPRLELVPYVLENSISIALVSFAMNFSLAQMYAKRFRYKLDANQELFALGSANLVSSFFSCFPCASSLSRSSVQSNLNVKSQLCSLFSCCLVVLIVCYFANILHDLPRSTLSCIIVVALKGILMQVRDLYDNWRLSKLDAFVWLFTFGSVLVVGVTYGLILGIVASMLMVFLRLLTPNHSILARLPGSEIYVDKNAFSDCHEIPQVKIFRFNSALCYLNRTILKSKIEKLLPNVYELSGFRATCFQFHARYGSTSENGTPQTRFLVLDCSALSYCDYSGVATLTELIQDLEEHKVLVYLAACPLKLIHMLEKVQASTMILRQNVYLTISDAVGQIRYLQACSDGKLGKSSGVAESVKSDVASRAPSLTGEHVNKSSLSDVP